MNTFFIKFFGGVSLLGFIASTNAMSLERIDRVSQKVSKKLELNENQKLKFQRLINSIKNESASFKKMKKEKFKLANTKNISKEEILKQFDSFHAQKKEVLNKVLPEAMEFRDSLSPKQKEKFNKVFGRLMKKVAKRWS